MDIEDLESNKLNLLFLKELLKYEFKSDSEYNKIYKKIRKKLKVCPSKPILRKLYNELLLENKIIENKLSVRQAEKFVQLFKNKRQKSKITKDANIIALELSVSNKIGLNVEINNSKRNKGKISFEYKDLDQLNKIIDIIKSNY